MFKYEYPVVQVIRVQPIALYFAFRYALGRRSYAPSVVASEIRENLAVMPKMDLEGISEEILEAYERNGIGDECDIKLWMNLRKTIEAELERRK